MASINQTLMEKNISPRYKAVLRSQHVSQKMESNINLGVQLRYPNIEIKTRSKINSYKFDKLLKLNQTQNQHDIQLLANVNMKTSHVFIKIWRRGLLIFHTA